MRRSRYTLTYSPHGTNDIERVVSLVYDPYSLRAWGEKRGTVLSVTKGDYRAQARKRAAARTPDGGWEFNMPAIREAFEAMTGAQLPAMLKFEKGRRGANRRGVFEWESFNGVLTRLTVRVRVDVEPVQANRTLWHELAHVAQFVRAPDFETYARGDKAERAQRHGYRNRPCEVEARTWEVLAEIDNLLTITNERG